MKVITFLNYKGGISKTTLTRTFATKMAIDYGKKVLCLDLDENCGLTASFGLVKDKGLSDMFYLLVDSETDPNERITPTDVEGVDIIRANRKLAQANKMMADDTTGDQAGQLRDQLKKIKKDYDYVVIDCPAAETIAVRAAIVASKEVIVPCDANQDCIDAVQRVKATVAEMKKYNPRVCIRGVLMSRVQNNSVWRDCLEIDFGPDAPKFQTYIRESVDVRKSGFARMSIHEFNRSCVAARDYDNFIAEYLGLPFPHPEAPYVKN